MSYYASGDGYVAIKEGMGEKLKAFLEKNRKDIDSDIDWDIFPERNYADIWESDSSYHEEDTTEFLDKLSPYIISGSIRYSGEGGDNWRFVFNEKTGKWSEEAGAVVYGEPYLFEEDGHKKDPYKVNQIDKHLEASSSDEYYNPQLTGAGAKPINLDDNALKILKAYYSGREIYVA